MGSLVKGAGDMAHLMLPACCKNIDRKENDKNKPGNFKEFRV